MAGGSLPAIAIIGGTGALGQGLAGRWAAAGHPIVIGSRQAEAAAAAAAEIGRRAGGSVRGLPNRAAAEAGDIVVLAVRFAHRAPILADIKAAARGKIVIDTTVPIAPPQVSRVRMPEAGSAAQAAQAALGPEVRVVSAFQTVAAGKLQAPGPIDGDVLVCGDDEAARGVAIALCRAAGLRGLHAGPLANSVAAEALASVLIGINRRYKVEGAGLRIVGDLEGADRVDLDAAAWAVRR